MRASAVDVIKLEPIRPINLAPPATRAVGFAAREKLQSSDSTISAIAATVRAHRVRMRLTPPFRSFACVEGMGILQAKRCRLHLAGEVRDTIPATKTFSSSWPVCSRDVVFESELRRIRLSLIGPADATLHLLLDAV